MADALAVVGVALSTVSLTLQAVDECIKFYKLFSEASRMPESHGFLQVQLELEQQRFLSFTEEVGLLSADMNLPQSLETHSTTVQNAVLELRTLFEKFQQANGRYVDLIPENKSNHECPRPSLTDLLHNTQTAVRHIDLVSPIGQRVAGPSKFDSVIENAKRRSKKFRRIVMEPRYLVWVAFDQEEFSKLVRKLAKINTYLIALLDDARVRRIEKSTEASYLEMLQMRNDVKELKDVVQALMRVDYAEQAVRSATTTVGAHSSHATAVDGHTSMTRMMHMKQLADIKIHRLETNWSDDFSDSATTHSNPCDGVNVTGSFASQEIPSSRQIISLDNESVWLENICYSSDLLQRNSDAALIHHRVYLLARLLSIALPEDFRTPPCRGYIKLQGKDAQPIFGLILKLPKEIGSNTNIFSLRDLLADPFIPSLSARIALSYSLATSLGKFHDVDWLHKGLRSKNVLLFSTSVTAADLSQPYVTGFELSRPSERQDLTDKATARPEVDIYRHPLVQGGENAGSYRKSFDLYSLGIVFLEIACWLPIESILGVGNLSALTAHELRSVKGRIIKPSMSSEVTEEDANLSAPPESVESSYLQRVSALCGDSYRDIVELLLRASEVEYPAYRGEKLASRSRRLQDVFRDGVLERLCKMKDAL